MMRRLRKLEFEDHSARARQYLIVFLASFAYLLVRLFLYDKAVEDLVYECAGVVAFLVFASAAWYCLQPRPLCSHRDRSWKRNIYGAEIEFSGYKRSIWRCNKCGKTLYSNVPVNE